MLGLEMDRQALAKVDNAMTEPINRVVFDFALSAKAIWDPLNMVL